MNPHYRIALDESLISDDQEGSLVYLLGDFGCTGSETLDRQRFFYFSADSFDEAGILETIRSFCGNPELPLTVDFVEGKNWNEEWEKNYFQPVWLGNRCRIRSSFHPADPAAEMEIVIDPKMSFGTGHHATTSMIAEMLFTLPLKNTVVMDMGSGTGILAIIAAKLGASNVTAVDNDPLCRKNAEENIRLNDTADILVLQGDGSYLDNVLNHYDILIANINLHVLLADMQRYADSLKKGGILMLSGFLDTDEKSIMDSASSAGLSHVSTSQKGQWLAMMFRKN